RKGLKGTFFGREVKTNPLVPKLVRQFDCEVYPARCIRLPLAEFLIDEHAHALSCFELTGEREGGAGMRGHQLAHAGAPEVEHL
ncbi:hypothetical protein ACC699_39225, partial [Rhizobium ruizarguesonis]